MNSIREVPNEFTLRNTKKRKENKYMSERLTKEMREFIPILRKNGYTHARTNGSHFVYINRTTHRHISVNKDLNAMVRLRLIKENNLEV